MKGLADLLLLGNPLLYQAAKPVEQAELNLVKTWVSDLHNTMEEIRARYHFGRGIAAPQLGIMKRLIYINIHKPMVMINPELTYLSPELFDVWDDCMCFPNLLVKVKRHRSLTIQFKDENWNDQTLDAANDLSELIQHEYDHLQGILCTMRAIDEKSFGWRK
ncbi:MAG: peptide deformylase [Bacteroidetes bacterium]|nr:peptide deformylase [Bacteroidota bacterium]MBS1539302.1 peptide deformylase [Bacteroidota bacterium]